MILLAEYFNVFGQKPCCFFDLRPYMSLLQGKLIDEFLKTLNEIVDLKEGEFPRTVSIFDILLIVLILVKKTPLRLVFSKTFVYIYISHNKKHTSITHT